MTESKIEAFLKLFRITESRHVFLEPSWQSWMVLCLCIASAIATASSGAYFHRSHSVKSSIICFTVSVAGLGMALVTFIAILMGCKRRQRVTAPVRNDEGGNIYTNHGIPEQSTCIQIEQEDLVTSYPETANQMWMNPVYAEYDKSLYEADWNKEKGPGKTFEKDETDFDERDSDYFHSSSSTCSYRSYSDDEGYFQYSSKERNLRETGKNSMERHRDHRWIPERKLLGVLDNIIVPHPNTSTTNDKSSITIQNSELDQFQTSMEHKRKSTRSSNTRICPRIISKKTIYLETGNIPLVKNTKDFHSNPALLGNVFHSNCRKHDFPPVDEKGTNLDSTEFQNNPLIPMEHEKDIKATVNNVNNSCACEKYSNGVFLIKSLELKNDSVTSNYLPFNTRIECSTNVIHHKDTFSFEPRIDLSNCLMHNGDNISTIVNMEDDSQSTTKQCECSFLPKPLEYRNCLASTMMTNEESSNSDLPDQNTLANKKMERSKHKLELPAEFPSLPYPILSEDSSRSKSRKERRCSRRREDAFMPRYEKRPLLDVNGVPISQKALVKTIARILNSGLQDLNSGLQDINSGLQELPKYSIESEVKRDFQWTMNHCKL